MVSDTRAGRGQKSMLLCLIQTKDVEVVSSCLGSRTKKPRFYLVLWRPPFLLHPRCTVATLVVFRLLSLLFLIEGPGNRGCPLDVWLGLWVRLHRSPIHGRKP